MIWLPRTTDNSTYFAQSLEIRGIESRLFLSLNMECVILTLCIPMDSSFWFDTISLGQSIVHI